MAKVSPYSFIVVLPQTIIDIPQSSNLSWLTLFYALPKELVEKRAEYLELPRNIHQVLQSEKYTAMIQTDSFLELVWDCYAWSAWQFFQIPHQDGTHHDIPGDWSHYSGDFPLWRLSYEIIKIDYFRHIRNAVAHAKCNYFSENGKNFVVFSDNNGNGSKVCSIKMECYKVGIILMELQKLIMEYYNQNH